MKTYIFIFGIADMVAGGPIYDRNKIKYVKEKGWNVVVLPTNSGKVYIKGLEEYSDKSFPFILEKPWGFTKRQRNALLDLLLREVPENQSEIIIETGTDYSSYWGEALAERLNAKHFVFHLDEANPRIDESVIDFYKFKYNRHELACITEQAMANLFREYMPVAEDKTYVLSACCSNSIEDYDSPIIDNIPRSDFIIGSIGRLEKAFVKDIVDGIITFADSVPDKIISVCFFGGSSETVVDNIRNTFSPHNNIKLYITGYIFPIPFNAIQKADLFISGAGSANATSKYGIPTVKIDVYNGEVMGLADNTDNSKLIKITEGNQIADYINYVFQNNITKKYIRSDYYDVWDLFRKRFDEHMEFIEQSDSNKEYFDLSKLGLSNKGKVKKVIRGIIGIRRFDKLKELRKNLK